MATRKQRGGWIMPNGQPLTLYLLNQSLEREERHRHGGRRKRAPGAPREPEEGWTQGLPPRTAASAGAAAAGQPTEAEAAEAAALVRVGQRRRRRWLNDRLLRDMASASRTPLLLHSLQYHQSLDGRKATLCVRGSCITRGAL